MDELQLTSRNGPQPSPRTQQLLHVYNLTGHLQGDELTLLPKLSRSTTASRRRPMCMPWPTGLPGRQEDRSPRAALRLGSLRGGRWLAYDYLLIRVLLPGGTVTIPVPRGVRPVQRRPGGRLAHCVQEWRTGPRPHQNHSHRQRHVGYHPCRCGIGPAPPGLPASEFVSDYEINGLTNRYQSHGLESLIAVHGQNYKSEPATARYYPPDLSFAVTAFLRPLPSEERGGGQGVRHQGLLELYDPLASGDMMVGQATCPWKAI